MPVWVRVVALAAMLAGGAAASVITLTANIPNSGTDSIDVNNAAATFNFFQSAGAPAGSVLTSVSLEIVISEALTGLTVHNNSGSSGSTRFFEQANFDASDSADATDDNNLDAALSNSGNQFDPSATVADIVFSSVSGGGSVTCTVSAPCFLPDILSVDTGLVGGTTASYNRTGTFTIGFSTSSSHSFLGGNFSTTSLTAGASAVATVQYTYSSPSTPEPASLVTLAGGLAGLALLRWKRMVR